MTNKALIAIGSVSLHQDKNDLISLTDLYRAAQSQGMAEGKRNPSDWAREAGSQFIDFLAENLHVRKTDIYKTSKARADRGGGTYAHWQIALAYAKYLSPELHMQVNETYMRFKSNDIVMAEEIADKATPEEQRRLEKRLQGKISRRLLTDTLKDHGVTGTGYGQCTNAIQTPILGASRHEVCKARGISLKSNLRDRMSTEELIITSMAELVASKSIQQNNVRGNVSCANHCRIAAERVANLLN